MKITTLEMANVKRIKALRLVPTDRGLTIIGGRNGAGKTSVLDAIAYGFGGEKFRPTNLKREGAVGETVIRIETDNGLLVERKGKNSSLTVTDRDGKRGGQQLLTAFLSELAINLPKFHNANAKEKAKILLGAVGVDEDALAAFDREEKAKYDTRTVVGQQADQKEKAAKDMSWHEDAPKSPVSAKELIEKSQGVLARNGVKEEARKQLEYNRALLGRHRANADTLEKELAAVRENIEVLEKSIAIAEKEDYTLESTDEIQRQIDEIEETNRKVAENAERERRLADADLLRDQYDALTAEIEKIRAGRLALLNGVEMPLEGLSVKDGELTYRGKSWDCMSGAEQLVVDCAIASKINPECRFVLMDKLEQLDLDTLKEFGAWLEAHDLQCIATRVSTGDECTITIEDGESSGGGAAAVLEPARPAPRGLPEEY